VPAGTVKVAVDGRTASNAPSGVFFPEMVMDVELLPGVTNTLMGGMGSVAKRLANIDRREVYLPRVPTSALQSVSDTATTVITLTDAASAPQLTEQQRAGLTLTVNPGSAIGENGEVLQDVQIGISTVPPELVRDMLPPGVLQHSFDITIQAPGVATFAEPVEISFPNVFDAAPGTKLNILSFDHTTGRLVINGTGTVSADGLTVVSDPGSGIRAPGWHGLIPPALDAALSSIGAALDDFYKKVADAVAAGATEFGNAADDFVAAAKQRADEFYDAATYIGQEVENTVKRLTDAAVAGAMDLVDQINKYNESADGREKLANMQKEVGDLLTFVSGVNPNGIDVGTVLIDADALFDHLKNGRILDAVKDIDAIVGALPPGTISATVTTVTTGAGTVVGAVVGGVAGIEGGPIGVGLGAALGGALGQRRGLAAGILLGPEVEVAIRGAAKAMAAAAEALELTNAYVDYYTDLGAHLIDHYFGTQNRSLSLISGVGRQSRELDATVVVKRDPVLQKVADRLNELADTVRDHQSAVTRLKALVTPDLPATVPQAVLDEVRLMLAEIERTEKAFRAPEQMGVLAQYAEMFHLLDSVAGFLAAYTHGDYSGAWFKITDVASGALVVSGDAIRITAGGVSLPPNSQLKIEIAGAEATKYGAAEFVTGPSGQRFSLPNIMMGQASPPDSDGDGIADQVEWVYQTNPLNPDSDNDGVSDLAEIKQHSNPLDGIPSAIGVVSASALRGSAEGLAIYSENKPSTRLVAIVASGDAGISLLDVKNAFRPSVLATLPLAGFIADVAVDPARALAAVAGGSSGLHLVDLSDPTAPRLLGTVSLSSAVTRVAVRDGIAYGIYGTRLAGVDLNTVDIRETLDLSALGGTTLTDIVIDGSTIYTMDESRMLRSISVSDGSLTALGSLRLASAAGRLFVGGGVAYVGTISENSQGYSTVDVSDPTNLRLLSGVDAANVAGQSLAANGSGLLVTAGNLLGPRGEAIYAVDVSNTIDPTANGAFLTRITLPAAPKDVVLANGLAFVADGTGGLQIVNYAGFDTKGIAPSVSITANGVDVDPATPGIQVLEGRTVRVVPTISDDVQVRNVELLVNGRVVANDVAFPWELFAQAPTIAVGGNSVTLQVRATDTGGNVALSNIVTLDVVPDTFAPQVASVSVDEGARRFFVRSVEVTFDEPLDLTRLNTSGVHLLRAGADASFGTADDVAVAVRLDTRNFGQSLSVLMNGWLPPGDYRFTIDPAIIADRAGNALDAAIVRHFSIRPASDVRAISGIAEISTAPSANPGQQIGIAVPFDPATARAELATVDGNGNLTTATLSATRWDSARGIAYFNVPINAVTGDAVVYSQVGSTRTDFADGSFPLQILPVIDGIDVQSVSGDGESATVVLRGLGFVEGNNSEYRFGSGATGVVLLDAGINAGPDVSQRYDPLLRQYISNGQVTLTVPLSDGAFGPISVKTAGGVSASYTVSLSGIESVALSGTPADAGQASANPGQAITLLGSGFTTSSDVLLRYTDSGGIRHRVQVSPTAAAADGSSASLIVPVDANGAFTLQAFGSASQPLLQIVPVLKSFTVDYYAFRLQGSGFVEGNSVYRFAGAQVSDNQADDADVEVGRAYDPSLGYWVDGGQVTLNSTANALPHFGLGEVTVSTAGGTSAALNLKLLRPGDDSTAVGGLGDVAIDPVTGALWVVDTVSPGHLLRIDEASGQVVQRIEMSDDFGSTYGSSYVGLQVLGQAMSLNGNLVPAGSLLLFNGVPYPDQVVAIDPGDGSVIASLVLEENHELPAGVFDASSGHLFVLSLATNELVEIDPASGLAVDRFDLAPAVTNGSALAIDPLSGTFWIGAYDGGSQLVEISRTGSEVRRVDLSSQDVKNNEITGLAFAPDGSLRVASSLGVVYRVDLVHDAAVPAATLTQVIGAALDGTPASNTLASANVGQIIELVGSHFNGSTQVLFNTRNNQGQTAVVAVRPLALNDTGTRLQVLVPDLASSGDIRVVNIGRNNLGFSGANDAIHRQLTLSFTAGSDSAVVRFADGGLQTLADESWGIDNVVVRQGASIVFADDFEGGAQANWSEQSTDRSATANFSEFSGRFNNSNQSLNLSGLSAGQTYTLSFDLYAIDSWEGSEANYYGPDLIDVSVDGVSLLRETVSNDPQYPQTLNASVGVRLQIVPTLTGIDGQPGGESSFDLSGSGFMEGASSVTIGGVALVDADTSLSPFDVTGQRNSTLSVVAPRTLDGPIRITTEGGYAQLAAVDFGVLSTLLFPTVAFTGITASALGGVPADAAKPSANTGQNIVLTGQGFSSNTLVQFQGIDDTGQLGTLTRTGSVGAGGTTLTVQLPALARSGLVTVLGSNQSFELQVVPTLRSVGGTLAPGNTLVLDGSGLTASDLVVQVDGRGVGSFSVRTVYDGTSNSADQQLLTLTVPNGVSEGIVTVSTAGGTSTLKRGVSLIADADFAPAADPGDTLVSAQLLALLADHQLSVQASIGDGAQSTRDVDLYRLDLNAGDVLSLSLSGLTSRLRIFDGNGAQLSAQNYNAAGTTAPLRWVAPAAGSYTLGVSGSGNFSYDPKVAGSGNASSTGAYTFSVVRTGAGSSSLSSIVATAASGTAANSGLASANTGQTITFNGVGLLRGDQLVFTVIDANGRLYEQTVSASSVADDGLSLTVVVPTTATTGRVRLAREQVGLFLQVVPTLGDIAMNAGGSFAGGGLTLTGSGFAEGASAVFFGAQRIDDISRSYGLDVNAFDNTRLYLTVPKGVATGPISVSTVGGTSAVFGPSLNGITASAVSGTADNAGRASANPGQTITLDGSGFDTSLDVVFQTIGADGSRHEVVVRPLTVNAAATQAEVMVPLDAVSGTVRLVGDRNASAVPLQILPVIDGIDVQSVSGDGESATVVLRGLGFVEGNNSEYRFGSGATGVVLLDAGINAGPDVSQRYDPLLRQYISNGQVTLTVPLSDGAFGPISVKTAGGVSASYTVSLSGIESVALSGTPADAGQASANPGQAITLLGSGFTTSSDVLLRYTDSGGIRHRVQVSPTAAAADGSSASLIVPVDANGAFTLQAFGSASQPLLQIVPVLKSFTVDYYAFRLQGSGFVEGNSVYRFAGAQVSDNQADDADVEVGRAYDPSLGYWVDGGQVTLNSTANALPHFGLGEVTVSTAGGTSAALNLKLLRPGDDSTAVGGLGDVAIDPVTGALWVVDTVSPGHLLRIDEASGQVVQRIEMSDDFGSTYGSSYVGLQVLGQAMSLNGNLVPAGSLLLFNGVPYPDQVVAIDPGDGSVIASLVLEENHELPAGVFDASSGHLFVLSLATNELVEIDPASGLAVDRFDLAPAVTNGSALAIDPLSGTFWIGAYDGGSQLVEISRTGSEIRRVDLSSQDVKNNEITGLAFAPDGSLRVASSLGVVYRVDLVHDAAVPAATLTQVIGAALDGTPASNTLASANVGQIIELVGSHFNGGTQVLFNTRNNQGQTAVVAVRPLALNDTGTRLQVLVPDLASSGDIRVVNIGLNNLGFSGANDAIHRQLTLSFTAGSDSAVVRFADGGLQTLADESWGIDNVVVRQGASIVFADDFEGGAQANWSEQSTDRSATAQLQ
jgi:hypothetical protein